jgi:hypothetical protein
MHNEAFSGSFETPPRSKKKDSKVMFSVFDTKLTYPSVFSIEKETYPMQSVLDGSQSHLHLRSWASTMSMSLSRIDETSVSCPACTPTRFHELHTQARSGVGISLQAAASHRDRTVDIIVPAQEFRGLTPAPQCNRHTHARSGYRFLLRMSE